MGNEKAIARAAGAEPVVVRVHEIEGAAAVISLESGRPDRVVGWPLRDLFEYNEELMAELKKAHADGDETVLYRAWATAMPYAAHLERARR